MRIAIIGGTGRQGPGMALRWAKAGHAVVIGSRQQEKAARIAAELNQSLQQNLIQGMVNAEAAQWGEVIAITVPYAAHRSTLEQIRPQVQGKIVIDVTVPLDPQNPRRLLFPPQGSATAEAQEILGDQAQVVAAFQHIPAPALRNIDEPLEADVLVCGESTQAKDTVIKLIQQMGMRGLDVGPLAHAPIVEGITLLLMTLNRRYKGGHAAIRITGLPEL
ncbi:MAG: NADPH-dependent F420 reductase [Nitrospinota bacterium]|nr:MAG: NADPH-dependent F420 reductase [Nitrospinota bacterium]